MRSHMAVIPYENSVIFYIMTTSSGLSAKQLECSFTADWNARGKAILLNNLVAISWKVKYIYHVIQQFHSWGLTSWQKSLFLHEAFCIWQGFQGNRSNRISISNTKQFLAESE